MSDPGRFCVSGSSSIGLTSDGSTEQEGSADAVASSKNSEASSSSSSDEGNVVEEVGENVASQESLVRLLHGKNFDSGVKDTTLDKLQLPEDWIEEIKETWLAFVERSGSRQAAREAV